MVNPDGIQVDASNCVDYGTEFCYQQISIVIVPTDPCGNQPWPLSRNTFNGSYTLYGTTQCIPGRTDCWMNPVKQVWYDWTFTFTFDTDDFCPMLLTYWTTDHLTGKMMTYNESAMITPQAIFVADNRVYGKIWVETDAGFPFVINRLETTKLEIGVIYSHAGYDFYELFPTLELNNTLVDFSGTFDFTSPDPENTPPTNWFSMVLSSLEPRLTLGVNPPDIRSMVFRGEVTCYFQFHSSNSKLFTETQKPLDGKFLYNVAIMPGDYLPPSVGVAAASATTMAVVIAVAAGAVCLAVGVILVASAVFLRRRRGYTTQTDSA
jgi:hypothetical protein